MLGSKLRDLAATRPIRPALSRLSSGMPSLVDAVKASEAASAGRLGLAGRRTALAVLGYLLYDAAAMAYARIQLGAAATEQLFMQGLQGTVVLELRLKNLSQQAELRGQLTPVSRPAPKGMTTSHRDFSILTHAPKAPASGSGRTPLKSGLSHEFLRAKGPTQLAAPVADTRAISVFAPSRTAPLRL